MEQQAPTPFLRLVARAFVENCAAQLHDYCFIFPNRRSGTFFANELANATGGQPIIFPEITSISQFVADFSHGVEISRIEALLLLYQEYRAITGNPDESFDKFSCWGDTILNDFNDADKYLVDPRNLFQNIKDLKEIQSNYLNEEQLEAIKEYFGETPAHKYANTDTLWKSNDGTQKFTSLWDTLYDLYIRFNASIEKLGVTYSGKMYKDAVAAIRNMAVEDFRHSKYVFVGFNVLSTSEYYIFKLLGQKGIADYYWDYNSPTFDNPQNKATRFVGRNIKLFKPKLDLHEEKITSFPDIRAIGIPSNIGQAKYTNVILEELSKKNSLDTGNAINTAVVLPEEFLLIPLLDSIDTTISNVNITMGYPLRYTDIASLVSNIAKMHKNARKEEGEFCYFHENIREVLAHPLLKLIAADDTATLISHITQYNLFYIKASLINNLAPSLNYIFDPVVHTNNTAALFEYLKRIISFVENDVIGNKLVPDNSIEMGFISAYIDQLNILASVILKYEIPMNDDTFFYLVNRIISTASIAFEGEPLEGLQIMGILETRCLDFENVIILSMNERIFPRKHYSRSFIPHILRKANGMATVEFQECMYAYYFYRLLSRAKNVTLLFDSRTQSISSGEPSRFVYQLQKLFPQSHTSIRHISFNIYAPKATRIEIHKNSRIMQALDMFRTDGSGRYLSASAINHYINCPLAFYFEKIEKLNVPDEMMEFMDYSTLGTIVHEVMQKIYGLHGRRTRDGIHVTPEIITKTLSDKEAVHALVHKSINKIYLHEENCDTPLTGETAIIGTGITLLVGKLLAYEKSLPGFTILQTEKEELLHWQLDHDTHVNIKQYIDRVDRVEWPDRQYLRIIDYKTGSDKTTASSVEKMFNARSQNRAKAMLQLMLYCNVYSELHKPDLPIRPIIYTIRNINESGFKVNRKDVECYTEINDEYMQSLTSVISEIFNPDAPFTQTKNENNCIYCKFVDFCRK